MDEARDKCGVFGISGPSVSIQSVRKGIHMLQHRGQDGCGMAGVFCDGSVLMRKGLGLVGETIDPSLLSLHVIAAVAHVRYSTQGHNTPINLQPHDASCREGRIILASNGHVENYHELRALLVSDGVSFVSENDGELLAKVIAWNIDKGDTVVGALRRLGEQIVGAYSSVFLFNDSVYAIRDPNGFRPLVMARIPECRGSVLSSGAIAFASETVSFDILEADPATFTEVNAGAIIEAHNGEFIVRKEGHPATHACSFCLNYFARPDGDVFGLPTGLIRERIGRVLGEKIDRLGIISPSDRDRVVIGAVPDSAMFIARGVSQGMSIRSSPVIIRHHYVHRTFIAGTHEIRDEGTGDKLNPYRHLVEGKIVIAVDDSIVRGTTIAKFVKILKRAGAICVIVAIGYPPVRFGCKRGIATPTDTELIANRMSIDEMCAQSGAAAIVYNDLPDLQWCLGPLTGHEREQYGRFLGPFLDVRDAPNRAAALERLEHSNPKRFCYACLTGSFINVE